MNFIEIISQPWPWYVSGPMITLVMFLLLKAGGEFGVSSTLRSVCSIAGAGKRVSFFNFDWKSQSWNIIFVLGAIIGGAISAAFLNNPEPLKLAQATIRDLSQLGFQFTGELMPPELFDWSNINVKSTLLLLVGGFLVGFGSRYAGGCTSGHAISGLSNLQLPSLIAVIGFFIGGLIMTYLIFPILF